MSQEPTSEQLPPERATDTAVPVPPPQAESNVYSGVETAQELLRTRRLLWLFGGLLAVLILPSVAGRIQYALTEAKERAEFEVARENLQDFNLTQFSTASRLLAQYVGPSVVNIRTSSGRGRGEGSGVIVDAEGYIVTNYHVVEGFRTAEIQLSDGRRGNASVVGADPLVDIAVLKTELENLKAAKWGDSDQLDVGETVWALGSPFGLQKSITFGIVSAKERRGEITAHAMNGRGPSLYQEFLQTDAAVNPGNSGGPLVNVDGEVVGINTAILGPTYQGISFSIPSSIVRDSYEKLKEDGWVERGYLGVSPSKLPDKIARIMGLEKATGVLVLHVEKNTPAWDADLQAGDVILTWDGIEFSDPNLMSRAIAATPIGSEVPVELMRKADTGSKKFTLTVKVAARPKEDS